MNQESVIADIERRARSAGISIHALCVRASVHPTTFSRWRKSGKNPEPVGASLHSIGRLFAALEQVAAENRQPAHKRAGGRA